MRIIHIIKSGSLSATIGPIGTIRRILSSRKTLNDNGYDIKLFANNGWFTEFPVIPNKNIKISSKRKFKLYLDNLAKKWYFLAVILIEYKWITHKFFVHKYFKTQLSCDVAVFHAELECYYYIKQKKKTKINSKIVLFLHNDGIPLQMYLIYYPCISNSWYYRVLLNRYKYILNNVDKCAFICKAGMDNCQLFFPFVKEKAFLIVNGITDFDDNERVNIKAIKKENNHSVLKLVSVGSVSIRKGQRYIINAMARLTLEERAKIHLDIVGDGPDYQICKQIVDKEHLNDNVKFWGAINNHEVYKVLAASDLFVLLSSNEGLPISIIEAMRMGLPIISTKVSGIPELLSYNNGILLNCNHREEETYDILKRALAFDWKEMGKNSRQAYEKYYTFDRMLDNYITMIDSLYQ